MPHETCMTCMTAGGPRGDQLSRRWFLRRSGAAAAAFALWGRAAPGGDVAWLAEVQRPPRELPPGAPAPGPLLVDPAGAPVSTLAGWRETRERLRTAWLEFLGPMPPANPKIELATLEEDQARGVTRRLVRYEGEPGLRVEGYLLLPPAHAPGVARDGRRAGLVALHQTSRDTILEIAGLRGPPQQHLGLRLAERGFVVFCPRCFLWQSAADFHEAVDRFRNRHPRALGMHKMLFDAARAVDLLASLEQVDHRRLGAVGHSLGAKESLYLAAFDERIAAAVASEGGIGFKFTNWDAPWYLGPAIHEPAFALDHHQLLALIAPRPFLILAGETGPGAADGDRTWPYVARALEVYRLYGQPPRLGLLNHREGHLISDASFERLAEWLETYLSAVPPRPLE